MAFKINLTKKLSTVKKKGIDEFESVALAKARLISAKIRMMERPVDDAGEELDPQLPLNITELSSEELGDLFGQFAVMSQYAIQINAVSDINKAARHRVDEYTRSKSHLEQIGTIADKKAQVEVDERVRESSFKLLTDKSIVALTDAMLQSYIIGRDACSREMSRRQTESGRTL